MTNVVMVWTTVPVGEACQVMARTLVEERLAACVSVGAPMTSVYRWDGRVTNEAEQQVIIKTTRERVPALRERLAVLHPYQLPEFLVCPVADGAPGYLDWVRSETVMP